MIVSGWPQDDTQRTTLDDLFRRAAVANPDAIALIDEHRQLTFADADRLIWAIAARLRALGLPTDAVVGLQLPNTIESSLTILGILRAGMIAALLPILWREGEMISALSSVGAKALITTARIGDTNHAALAMRVAAGLFSIRHVCAFGQDAPDGVVPLDEVFIARPRTPLAVTRGGNPAAHAAIVTFNATSRGIQPVARNHSQLIAGGHPIADRSQLTSAAVLLSAMPLSSFAALATIFIPWLLCGAQLVLHHPLDMDVFGSQAAAADVIAVPGALAPVFALTGRTIIACWRAAERIDPQPVSGSIVDVVSFGEFGLQVDRRESDRVAPLTTGANALPRRSSERASAFEATRTTAGTLALRGGMVAKAGFSPTDHLPISQVTDEFVDTGYPCRIEPDGAIVITGPQPGMIGIGGYRIASHDLDLVGAMTPFGILSALPHALLGQRLAGASPEQGELRAALEAKGLNALIVGAFSRRDAA